MADAERCVGCGEIIPEGRQVCPVCLAKAGDGMVASARDSLEMAETYIHKALAKLALVKGW